MKLSEKPGQDAADAAAYAYLYPNGTPATPCPTWCTVGTLHADGDHYHFARPEYVGNTRLSMEIRDDDTPAVLMSTEGEGDYLDLTEIDEMIAKLTALRGVLADGSAV